jgi:hypothetical protein
MIDVTKSYLPFATVISLVFFVAWSTRVVTMSQLETEQKFTETARVVKELAGATKEIADAFVTRDQHGWLREDMVNWCERQQFKIPELVCPTLQSAPYSRINDSGPNINKAKRKLDSLEKDPVLQVEPPQ